MTIKDPNKLLSKSELDLLKRCAKKIFVLGRYHSLDDILTKLNVDVIIDPDTPKRDIPPYLEEAEKYWKKAKENDDNLASSIADDNIKRIEEEKETWHSMRLRGLYDSKKNQIKLFPEEMRQEYGGKHMDELLVSTFAHETMHAYFNRSEHEKYPYVLFVEEPLAEFGMLLYLYETKSNFYDWAYQDVSSKKTCYQYGAAVMDEHLAEINNGALDSYYRQKLETYRRKIPKFGIPEKGSNFFGQNRIVPRTYSDSSISVNNIDIRPNWQRHFYDDSTQTLGLDGDWNVDLIMRFLEFYDAQNIYFHHNFFLRNFFDSCVQNNCDDMDFDWRKEKEIHRNPVSYWDEHTKCMLPVLLERVSFVVSPQNRTFYSENGILYFRSTKRPISDNLPQITDNTITREKLYEIYKKALEENV